MTFEKDVFMPFFVLGDPNPTDSVAAIRSAVEAGAGALELGFAFSDPIADGPAVQKANYRALAAGMSTARGFSIIEKIRLFTDIPISVMLSYNIVFQYGVEKFYDSCKRSGVNAVLVPDVSLEESDELLKYAKKYDINQVFLVSPTSTDDRLKKINRIGSGYAYLVSLIGITGTRTSVSEHLGPLLKRARKYIDLPLYAGFGISQPKHVVTAMALGADGVITGSAICNVIEKHQKSSRQLKKAVYKYCKAMSL